MKAKCSICEEVRWDVALSPDIQGQVCGDCERDYYEANGKPEDCAD